MSEIKIARFVGIEACQSIFSENSTFVLRSPQYYRRLYEASGGTDQKADSNEGRAKTPSGGTAEFTGFLASCWTAIEGNEPTADEWKIFGESGQNTVAIVTTARLVDEFLRTAFHMDRGHESRRFPFLRLEHDRVCYGNRDIDHRNIFDVVPFAKDRRFAREREYRFVLRYAWRCAFESLVFCGGIEYMQWNDGNSLNNFINPGISTEDRKRLGVTLSAAGSPCGDFAGMSLSQIVANADILFR